MRADQPEHPAAIWEAVQKTAARIVGIADPIRRNREITAAYARLFLRRPVLFHMSDVGRHGENPACPWRTYKTMVRENPRARLLWSDENMGTLIREP